jgi:hypothetical protein
MLKKFLPIVIILEIIIIFFIFIKIINNFSKTKTFQLPNNSGSINDYTPLQSDEIIHPYLGFIKNYNSNSGINSFGFDGPIPLQKKSRNKIIIGIFGGSVANLYWIYEKNNLIQELKKYPKFKNTNFEIVTLAAGGYKQPQQLMTFSYLLSLGGEFDIVINIDGFNEAALPYAENIPNQISSFYPRSWELYSQQSFNMNTLLQIYKISQLEKIRDVLKTNINFLKIFDVLMNKIINHEQLALADLLSKEAKSFQSTGPEKFISKSDSDLENNVINVWANSSIQMNNLAKNNQILYLHYLQPNQYFQGSKHLTNNEKNIAFNNNHPYKKGVELIYPKLIEKGKELTQKGVLFNDLTMLFKNINDDIYIDDCCHYNNKGFQLITNKIVNSIIENFIDKK